MKVEKGKRVKLDTYERVRNKFIRAGQKKYVNDNEEKIFGISKENYKRKYEGKSCVIKRVSNTGSFVTEKYSPIFHRYFINDGLMSIDDNLFEME